MSDLKDALYYLGAVTSAITTESVSKALEEVGEPVATGAKKNARALVAALPAGGKRTRRGKKNVRKTRKH